MANVTSQDGTRIGYDKTGAGQSVILVNGATCYRDFNGERPLAAELSKEFTVITYDRRGRGESSDTQPYAVEREIEDIEALIDIVGAPVYLYGHSSGAALALKTTAKLEDKVIRLALYEPPFNTGDDQAKQASIRNTQRLNELLAADQRGDAVAFFMANTMPPDVIEDMRQSPAWSLLEAIAPTLAYDYAVMGGFSPPLDIAKTVEVPTLILNGSAGLEFTHKALETLASAMPNAERRILEGQTHNPALEVLTPLLAAFFKA